MSLVDFQTKYPSFVEGMVRSAICETTKLFETIIDELKEELSKVKKENEELQTKCNLFEMENKRLCMRAETESALVQTTGVETCDEAVQCDLVLVPSPIVEKPQSSVVNQRRNGGSAVVSPAPLHQPRRRTTEKESQMTETFVVKEEESDPVLVSKHLIRDTADNVPFYVLSVEHCQPLPSSIQTHEELRCDDTMPFLHDHQYCGTSHPALKVIKQEKKEWHCSTMEEESDDDAAAAFDIGNQTDKECVHIKDNTALSKLEHTAIQAKNVFEDESQVDPNGPQVVSVESLGHTYSSKKTELHCIKQHIKPTFGGKSPSVSSSGSKQERPIPVVERNSVPLQDAMLLVEAMNQQIRKESHSPIQVVKLETVQSSATGVSLKSPTICPCEAPKTSKTNTVVESDMAGPVILSAEPTHQNINKLSLNISPPMLSLTAADETEPNAQPLLQQVNVSGKPLTRCSQEVLVTPGTQMLVLRSTHLESNVVLDKINSPQPESTSESQTSSVNSRKAYHVSRFCAEPPEEGSPTATKASCVSPMQPVVVIRLPRIPTPDIDKERWTTRSTDTTSKETLSPEERSTSSPTVDDPESYDVVPSKMTAPVSEESMEAMDLCESGEGMETEQIQELQAAPLSLVPILPKDLQVPQLHMTKTQFLAQLAVRPTSQPHKKPITTPHRQAEKSSPEAPASRKRKSPNTSFVARLRSHLKTRLEEKKTKARPDSVSEMDILPLSPKKAKLESDQVKEASDTTEPVHHRKSNMTKDAKSPHPKTKSSGICKDSSPGIKFTWRTLTLSQNADSEGQQRDSVSNKKGRRSNSSFISEKSPSARSANQSKDGSEKSTGSSKRISSVTSISTSQSSTRSGTTFQGQCSSSKENTSPKKSPSCKSTNEGPILNYEILTPKGTRDKSPHRLKSLCTQTVSPNHSSEVSQNAQSDSETLRRPSIRTDKGDHSGQMTKHSTLKLKKSRSSDGSHQTDSTSAVPLKPSLTKDFSKESATGSTYVTPKKVTFSEVVSETCQTEETTDFEAYKKNGVLWTKVTNDCEGTENVDEDKCKSKVSLKVSVAKKLPKAAKSDAKRKYSSRSKLQTEGYTTVMARNRRQNVKKDESDDVWTPPKHFKTERKSLELATGAQDKTARQDKSNLANNKSDKTSSGSPSQKSSKYQCKVCGRILCSKVSLESHANLHIGQRPYPCTSCTKTFADARSLKRHERVHRDNRTYVCLKCGKGFVYQFGLTKHTRMVHTRFKPFVCQICNKAFFTKQEVEGHIRRHTGETPFHCTLCEKKFVKKVELIVHMRWHNGEKRHWCPYCGKGFLDNNNLKRHKFIHTGEKPHVCPYCQKRFTQSSHVKKHIRNVHKMPINV